MSLKESLTKKIGPLPAVVWGGIGLAIFGIILWYKHTHGANGVATTETTGDDEAAADAGSDSDTSSDYAGDGASSGVGAGGSTGGITVGAPSTSPQTNQAWLAVATSYLIGFGYTATQINQALNNWLSGNQATPQDNALFNLAVAQFGEPPEGVPPQPTNSTVTPPGLPGGTTQPPGTPAPTPAKPAPKPVVSHTYYTVVSGDNLTKIASKYKISESTLYSNNKAAIEASAKSHGHSSSNNGNLIFPGLRLLIK